MLNAFLASHEHTAPGFAPGYLPEGAFLLKFGEFGRIMENVVSAHMR